VPSPPPQERARGGQRVWAFHCPNPTCDTELVIFPEYAGATVQCPTCGFAFLAPRVVPLQIVSEEEGDTPSRTPRPFAPGAVLARPGPAPSEPRPPGSGRRAGGDFPVAAPGPAAPDLAAAPAAADRPPKATPADVAAQVPETAARGSQAAEALSALARTVGTSAPHRPAPEDLAGLASTGPAAAPGTEAEAPDAGRGPGGEALQALARAASGTGPPNAANRRTQGKKGGIGARMASAVFQPDRRRTKRLPAGAGLTGRTDSDGPHPVHPDASRAAHGSPGPESPLSEGEPADARRRRSDLVVTWAVAAIVSTGLALAAYVTGVPDIGLASLLFVGLAGARTYWITRSRKKGGAEPWP